MVDYKISLKKSKKNELDIHVIHIDLFDNGVDQSRTYSIQMITMNIRQSCGSQLAWLIRYLIMKVLQSMPQSNQTSASTTRKHLCKKI